MDRACLISWFIVMLGPGLAACGGGKSDGDAGLDADAEAEDDTGLDADADPDLYEVVELENPCQLPPGVEPGAVRRAPA